jgi:hypothetical protein
MTMFKPMTKAKKIRCAIFSVLCMITALLFITSIILEAWWDVYPFWKVTVTQCVALFIFNYFTD